MWSEEVGLTIECVTCAQVLAALGLQCLQCADIVGRVEPNHLVVGRLMWSLEQWTVLITLISYGTNVAAMEKASREGSGRVRVA